MRVVTAYVSSSNYWNCDYMSAERYGYWDKFEERGSEGGSPRPRGRWHIRRGQNQCGPRVVGLPRDRRIPESNRASLAEAKSANDLARSANTAALEANSIARFASDLAKRSAKAAWTSNIIAAAALIAAIIAMVIK